MSGLAELGKLWHTIQAWLLPVLEDELGQLDHQHREFVAVCEIARHASTWRPTAGLATAARPKTAWQRPATRGGAGPSLARTHTTATPTRTHPGREPCRPAAGLRLGHEERQQGQEADLARRTPTARRDRKHAPIP